MKKINKNDLIELVSEKEHLSKKDTKAAIDTAFELMREALLNGQEVVITNFGSFVIKERKPRKGTHPRNHTPLIIEGGKTIVYKPAVELKEKIK